LRQHCVPRAYLAQFTDPDTPDGQEPFVWVWKRGAKGPFARAPKKLAVKKYYYSISLEGGEADHTVEEFFSQIESSAIPVLKRLAEGTSPADLSEDDRYSLAFFVGLLSVRIPGFRNHLEKFVEDLMKKVALLSAQRPDYFERTMKEAYTAKGEDPPKDIESARQFMLSGEYDVKADPVFSLQMLVALAPDVADYAWRSQWRVLRTTPDQPFVTSDRPVVLATTMKQPAVFGLGAGWATPWMEAIMPLSPEASLLMSLHHSDGVEDVGPSVVTEVNQRIATFATEQVYSSTKLLSTPLDRPVDWEWWTPVSVDGPPPGSAFR